MGMDVVVERCAGLDVHKKTVSVCLRCTASGGKVSQEVRTYDTFTRGLVALLDWLRSEKVTHVAMESTGVYWKPVFNILEGHFEELLLVNARHIRQVPGRKTDVKDCQWIAQLLQHGLLKPSFVPTRQFREVRDLTRSRVNIIEDKTRVANRIQQVLEDANVKLGSVASDVLGKSGRTMIEALIRGASDHDQLAELARGRLRGKVPELKTALQGHVTDHHRFMLELLFHQLTSLEELIEQIDCRLEEVLSPFEGELTLLETIPGFARRNAENLLAEIGPRISQFPTPKDLASWVAVCPGNHESAGKRRTGKTAKGNRFARRVLTQAAWASVRVKASYLGAQYRRIASRRGRKRAIVAVAHSITVAVHHMLTDRVSFKDLGADFFDKLNRDGLQKYYVKRLRNLGFEVQLQETSEDSHAA